MMVFIAWRRRSIAWRFHAGLVGLAPVACTDEDAPQDVTSSSTETSSTDEESSGTPAWPAARLGEYYLDPGWPIGTPLMGDCSPGWLENMRLSEGLLTVEGFTCRGDAVPGSGTSYQTRVMDDGLQVLPIEANEELVWLGGVAFATIVVRAGDTCDELRAELVTVNGTTLDLRWVRGRLCLVDPYDESVAQDTFLVELCEGAAVECRDGSGPVAAGHGES